MTTYRPPLWPKGRPFDPRNLWRALELNRLCAEAWTEACSPATAQAPGNDELLWLAPHEQANLELQERFIDLFENDPRYSVPVNNLYHIADPSPEAEAFAQNFGRPSEDPLLEEWLVNGSERRTQQARIAVEKEWQRTHEVHRHWQRELRATEEYQRLVDAQLAIYALPAPGDPLPPRVADEYRIDMGIRLRQLEQSVRNSLDKARNAHKLLELHRRLVALYPPSYDALAALGGRDAYLHQLADELTTKACTNELLLNVHGKSGFARLSDASLEALQRALENEGSWRRSLVRTLRCGSSKIYREGTIADRLCRDLLSKEAPLRSLCDSPIGAKARSYVYDQLLAPHVAPLEQALCEHFGPAELIAAMTRSANPTLRKRAAAFGGYAATERARAASLKRARTEAAVAAGSDPYLAYPVHRVVPRTITVHVGPTNAGKTHDALEAFRAADRGIYLGPLRLLAAEVADASCDAGCPCSLVTGEERQLVPDATHTASTIEMFDPTQTWDAAVVDEAQMVGDRDRGGAWCRALIGLDANQLHVCCAPEGPSIVRRILEGCAERFGDRWSVVEHRRLNPLEPVADLVRFPDDIQEGDAVVVFSKRDVHAAAAELRAAGHSCCVVYGALPHSVRRAEAKRFSSGEARVVVATDAIGMGMNLPVHRVVFLRHDKYDGHERRELTSTEVKQIAGRAGRYGHVESGLVASAVDPRFIAEALAAPKKPVKQAVLAFPRDLLAINAPVSALLDAWSAAKAPAPFRCADYAEEAALAERAEAITGDTQTVYAFAMIPFKANDQRVLDLWRDILEAHVAGEPFPDFDKGWDPDDLDSMQLAYDKLDLVYAALTGPASDATVDPDDVAALRDQVTSDIAAFLARQTYESRTCSSCGRPLPWSHRFGICDACFKRGRHARR